jgi:DNA-binding response OmpR family regulator
MNYSTAAASSCETCDIRKILIVDDDRELSDALTEQLSQYQEVESSLRPTAARACRLPKKVKLIW